MSELSDLLGRHRIRPIRGARKSKVVLEAIENSAEEILDASKERRLLRRSLGIVVRSIPQYRNIIELKVKSRAHKGYDFEEFYHQSGLEKLERVRGFAGEWKLDFEGDSYFKRESFGINFRLNSLREPKEESLEQLGKVLELLKCFARDHPWEQYRQGDFSLIGIEIKGDSFLRMDIPLWPGIGRRQSCPSLDYYSQESEERYKGIIIPD
jgi:hypothetical protein